MKKTVRAARLGLPSLHSIEPTAMKFARSLAIGLLLLTPTFADDKANAQAAGLAQESGIVKAADFQVATPELQQVTEGQRVQ